MTPSISTYCPHCRHFFSFECSFEKESKDMICPHCQKSLGQIPEEDFNFDQCPCCPARQFYLTKDFNRLLGCLIMSVGIGLVPWTYGLSLPIFALIDWLFYRKVPMMAHCYRCGAEFRNFSYPKRLKQFMHHIGLKYDKYR